MQGELGGTSKRNLLFNRYLYLRYDTFNFSLLLSYFNLDYTLDKYLLEIILCLPEIT